MEAEYTEQEILEATELVPTLWILQNNICNENGTPIEFHNHRFMWDVYNDLSQFQVLLKPPQIGATVMNTIKCFFIAKKLGKQIIYTLPTQGDIQAMVGGSINRIIAQNPILSEWVKEHDTIEQKTVGTSMIFYRGTFTAKQAMMIPSNLNVHDETDSSNQSVIENYETRLQADPDGMRWYFSHPSLPDYGVDKYWQISDQKHWFITCPHCEVAQYLSWPDSIDSVRRCYQCKECKGELSDDDRRNGQWYAKQKDKLFSGYWISQLMCPWITADKILNDFAEKTPEYFYNYVLGLPYAGGDAKLTENHLFQNLSHDLQVADTSERIVIGIDTGAKLDYVLGNERLGLFHHGDSTDYKELNNFMTRWPNAIAIIDAGGDFIGAQKFAEQWQGRVFKAYAGEDRKNNQLFRWGERNDQGQVIYDLNRTWQLLVDEFRDKRLPLQGEENDWWEYWLDWKNMSRIKVYDPITNAFKGIKWVRNGRNHRASATLFWRIGMDRFSGGSVSFVGGDDDKPRTGIDM
jgi:hypothetical protein